MGLMSSLFGGGEQKQTTTTAPWGPQQDYLKDVFGQAKTAYGAAQGTPWYTGDLHAGLDPTTTLGLDMSKSFATGSGAQGANQLLSSGLGMLGGGSQGMDAYSAMQRMAGGDPTQANIQSAMGYANNPAMDGMVDAASRDVTRNLRENVLPEIDRNATATGNINSSRAGVASGIAQRGAQDMIGDISSNLRGQAFQNGLSLAEQSRQANMGAMGQAGSGFMGAFNSGVTGAGTGIDAANANNANLVNAGKIVQADKQGQLDADYTAWQGNDNRAFDLLNKYMGIVGANNWGGTGTTTTQGGGQGLVTTGLGIASALKGLGAFSDRRLKKNIRLIGTDEDGLRWYNFEYRHTIPGFETLPYGVQRGVMADEIAELRPEFLGPEVDGYKTVDYEGLTPNFGRIHELT